MPDSDRRCHFSDCTLVRLEKKSPSIRGTRILDLLRKSANFERQILLAFEAVIIRSESSLVYGHFRNGRLASTSFFSLSLLRSLAGHAVGAHAVGLPSRGRDRHRGRLEKRSSPRPLIARTVRHWLSKQIDQFVICRRPLLV